MANKPTLAEKVRLYIERINDKRDNARPPSYDLNEVGLYRLRNHELSEYADEQIKVYRGRFIDVIAHAVRLPDFYGDWMDNTDPGNCNCGYLEKVKIVNVKKRKGLEDDIKEQENLRNKRKMLREELKRIKKEIGDEDE